MDRRTILAGGVSALAAAAVQGRWNFLPAEAWAAPSLPSGIAGAPDLEALPGKVPLIKKSYRPPNFETPTKYFDQAFTPNDAFFVRYHLANIPEVDAASWRLKIGGPGAQTPFELTLDDLKTKYPKVEIAAVCQCSGNRRGLSDPHVAGVEWGYGAMGNAKWGGVRLKDILAKAGLAKEALEISLNGADGGVYEQTPDFVKSIPVWKAMDENTLIAFEMNGAPLPHFNGFPARVIVPGWTATYWMKHVVEINVLTEPLKNFWMATAYRVPSRMFPVVERFTSQEAAGSPTTPITEIVVNSLITSHEDGAQVKAGKPVTMRGVAWDGGYGIKEVAISTDGGKSWSAATLGPDLGRFAWRQFSHTFTPAKGKAASVMARARNNAGATQVDKLLFNGAGYHNNVVQTLALKVV